MQNLCGFGGNGVYYKNTTIPFSDLNIQFLQEIIAYMEWNGKVFNSMPE